MTVILTFFGQNQIAAIPLIIYKVKKKTPREQHQSIFERGTNYGLFYPNLETKM